MLSERPNPIDLPDDTPDAVCTCCWYYCSGERAKELEGCCPYCKEMLESMPDN